MGHGTWDIYGTVLVVPSPNSQHTGLRVRNHILGTATCAAARRTQPADQKAHKTAHST